MRDEAVPAEATGSLPVPVSQLVLDEVVNQRLGVLRILRHMHTVTRGRADTRQHGSLQCDAHLRFRKVLLRLPTAK